MAASAPPQEPQAPRPLRRTGPIIPRRTVAVPDEQDDAQRKQQVGPGQEQDSPTRQQDSPGQEQGDPGARDAMLRRTGPIRPRVDGLRANTQPPRSDALGSDALLLEPNMPVAPTLHAARPSLGELLLHPFKSLYMVVALLVDRRVSFVRKLVFVVPIAVMVAALLVPETVVGLLAGIVAPVIGLALDVPIDAAVDWLGVGLLAVALLHVFPEGIVAQYHAQLFHKQRGA